MGIWRKQADILPSSIVLVWFSVQLGLFFTLQSLPALFAAMLFFLAVSACPGSISHNHHHYPTFRYAWMNRGYELILFLQTGVPPFAWTLHHNLGHHKLYRDQEHDPSGWLNPDGTVMNRVRYDIYNAARVYPEIAAIGRSRPKLYRRFKFWAAVSLSLLALLLLINPLNALILFILPMPIMLLGLLDNTYQQHKGLDTRSDYTASRNTTSKLYNLISWNLGYHTAHHMKPSLHWSELPTFHEEIRQRIPTQLICNSIMLSACDRQPKAPLMAGRGGRAPAGGSLAGALNQHE